MTASSNPTAIAMIADMIADTQSKIRFNEAILRDQLQEIKTRADEALEYLDKGYGIMNTGIDQRATKVAEYVAARTAHYNNLASLKHAMKAAGGDPDVADMQVI